jgi:hypothetical protein
VGGTRSTYGADKEYVTASREYSEYRRKDDVDTFMINVSEDK